MRATRLFLSINKQLFINGHIIEPPVIPWTFGKQSVVLKADGDTKRFLAVLEEFNKAKSVTAKRMYLDTLEEIMSNPNIEKIILPEGNSAGPILPFLPLNSITSAPAGATGPAISNPAANEKK